MGDSELQMFADRLRELRASLKITQVEFVDGLGITTAALSAYENNLKNPSISVAKRIAEKYNVSIDWLCGLSDKKNIKAELVTYSDLLGALINICDADAPLIEWGIICNDGFNVVTGLYDADVPAVSITCNDTNIYKFCNEWSQMRALRLNGTIDDYLYQLWLKDKLANYEHLPLSPFNSSQQ